MHRSNKEMNFKFVSGIACLLLFVLLGIAAVETQLNTLTLESDFAKVLNLRRSQDAKTVSAYILGEQIPLGDWTYPNVEFRDGDLVVELSSDNQMRLPMQPVENLIDGKGDKDFRTYYQDVRLAFTDLRAMVGKYYTTLIKNLNYYF